MPRSKKSKQSSAATSQPASSTSLLLSLPSEILDRIIALYLKRQKDSWDRQRARLRLARVNKQLRNKALAIDADLLVIGGNNALMNFPEKNADRIRRLEVQAEFEVFDDDSRGEIYGDEESEEEEPPEYEDAGIIAPTGLGKRNQRLVDKEYSHYGENILLRLSCFTNLEYLVVKLNYAGYEEEGDEYQGEFDVARRILEQFRGYMLRSLKSLSLTSTFVLDDIGDLWRFLDDCRSLVNLHLDQPCTSQAVGGFVSFSRRREPPKLMHLTEVELGHGLHMPLESVFFHAKPSTCHLKAPSTEIIDACTKKDGVYPAALAPRSLSLDILVFDLYESEKKALPNVVELEAEAYSFMLVGDDTPPEASALAQFPGLKTLKLGKEFREYLSPDEPAPDARPRIRKLLVETVKTLPRGLQLSKTAKGWSMEDKLALAAACRGAGVGLTWR